MTFEEWKSAQSPIEPTFVPDLERGCEGKQRFFSRQDAREVRQKLVKAGKLSGRVDVYHCGFCDSFHLGHRPKVGWPIWV